MQRLAGPFIPLSWCGKGFTLDVITRGQSTTIFLRIGRMVANEQTNSQVILVQACSWSMRRQCFAKIGYFSFKRKVRLPFAKTPDLNPQVLNVGGLFGSSVCWKTFVKYNFVKIYFVARVPQKNIKSPPIFQRRCQAAHCDDFVDTTSVLAIDIHFLRMALHLTWKDFEEFAF